MMARLVVPEPFATRAPRVLGPECLPWLAAVPGLADRFAHEWDLTLEGPAWHGLVGVAQPVRRADGTPAVLKLGWQDEETRDEPLALSTWAGRGAVLLLESAPDEGVLLLERLDHTRTLPGEPVLEAVGVMSDLARRLAVPAPPQLSRTLPGEAERLLEALPKSWHDLGGPFPRRELDAALEVCRDLGPGAGGLLVNEDLHYENVLAGRREPWLVIDPKPLAGDLEYGVFSLLWNRFGESTVEDKLAAAGFDADRARAWTLVRAVQNRLWFEADLAGYAELGDEQPAREALPALVAWAVAS
nr:aminoglycoside phosphotransferase family protein [Amycolatopsis sp. FDAARGOS 1241]